MIEQENMEALAALMKEYEIPADIALRCWAVLWKAECLPSESSLDMRIFEDAVLKLWDWQEDDAVIVKRKLASGQSFEIRPIVLLYSILATFSNNLGMTKAEAEEYIDKWRARNQEGKKDAQELRAAGKWKPKVGMIARALDEVLKPVRFARKQDKWLLMYKLVDLLPDNCFTRPTLDIERIASWGESKSEYTEKAKWIASCLKAYEGKAMDWQELLKPADKSVENKLNEFQDLLKA